MSITTAATNMLDVMPMGEAMSSKEIVSALAQDPRYFYSAKSHHAALAHLVDAGQLQTFTVEEGGIITRYYRRIDQSAPKHTRTTAISDVYAAYVTDLREVALHEIDHPRHDDRGLYALAQTCIKHGLKDEARALIATADDLIGISTTNDESIFAN